MAGGSGDPTRVIITALIANFIIAICKFGAFFYTRSSAMLAEGFHSLADTGNQVLLLLGVKRADKPPDETHPYGYGKDAYFFSFVVAISIFTIGASVAFYEGTHKLFEVFSGTAAPVQSQVPAFIVLGISIVVEGYAFMVALKEYRKDIGDLGFMEAVRENRSAAVVTVLFEDSAAVAGLAIALIGVALTSATGNPIYDGIATLLIGVILTVVAWFLGFMTYHLLIGQSANKRDTAAIKAAIEGVEGVEQMLELKTLHMGEKYILVNVGVVFRQGMTTLELESCIDRIEQDVKTAVPSAQRIFIEADSFRTPKPSSAGQ
ncbi:MAG: cation diffusion facilitator family transporter [Myxococcota bacterium]|jgi:cation diffusion facilitator family transporter